MKFRTPVWAISAFVATASLLTDGARMALAQVQRVVPTKKPATRATPLPPNFPTKTEIPNFAQVAPGIYRGAAPTEAGLKKLRALGVKHIIDLRIESRGQTQEAESAKALGLARTRIRLGREAPTQAQVRDFFALVDNAPKTPVFIHCQYGADRTGAMVGLYRVTRQGWSFDDTWKEMRRYGFKPYLSELKGAVSRRAKR